jgi:hypothetical protein
MEVSVSFIEKIFNVGTIKFFSGKLEDNDGTTIKVYDRWEAIPNPYAIFKQVKQVTVDIK